LNGEDISQDTKTFVVVRIKKERAFALSFSYWGWRIIFESTILQTGGCPES
jgi:hypothetical protein